MLPRLLRSIEPGDEMPSDESGGSESGMPGGRRRRPPSTIELEATEVPSDGGAPGESAKTRAEPDPAPDYHPAAKPGPAPDPEPTQTGAEGEEPTRRRNGAWRWI